MSSFGGWFKTSSTHEIDPESTSGVGGVNNQRYAFDPQHGGESNSGAGLSVGTNGILVYEHGSAESVDLNVKLSWTGGFGVKLHYVYLGDNFDDVNNAAGGLPQGTTSYTPGPLTLGKTYYWRVDEVDNTYADSPWVGPVWSFTTANFLIVDDFESYNDLDPTDPASNRMFNAWLDSEWCKHTDDLVQRQCG